MAAQKDNSSLVFMSGVVLGAVVGGAVALLFAPASGEETRAKIAKESKKAVKDIKKGAKELGAKVEPALEEVKKGISQKVEEVREGFEKGVKAVRK